MPKKESSSRASSVAGKALSGKTKPTKKMMDILSGSVLSQDETKGQSKKKRR
jgi:uridine kinase